eukprot:Gregarina_sp_Pseudo_9__1564@NODE_204_length_3622_cov_40_849009_g189_i0_p3_GENE_NODE_204_length_3622_cov_40_849009_g189_i0NODE_204_length_3622_cov_40_849009_g189_i0_p3_ORF_typecomplete_len142_score14_83_NODE_204_length_3622_cov_40_849009_g189_i011436
MQHVFRVTSGLLSLASHQAATQTANFPVLNGEWRVTTEKGELLLAHESFRNPEIPWPRLTLRQQAENIDSDQPLGDGFFLLPQEVERHCGAHRLSSLWINGVDYELPDGLAADKWSSVGFRAGPEESLDLSALRLIPLFYR